MESETFRGRVGKLLQKSRKALRLYTNMGRIQDGDVAEYSEIQVEEWREVNAQLLRQLASAMEISNARQLSTMVYKIRDQFYADWRDCQARVHDRKRTLSLAVDNSDFIKAVILSKELISLKARLQATQAAYHELQSVIEKGQVRPPTEQALEAAEPDAIAENSEGPLFSQAKVIPMRRRS